MNERMRRVAQRLRPHLGKAALLLVGFVLGGSVFALRSCTAPDPHSGHAGTTADSKGSTETIWTCAMHPQIRKAEPGQCPICGMDLIPVTSDEENGAVGSDRVVLSERAKALIKLRTAPVRRQTDASAELRLLGRIEADETTLKTITAWTGGRIDRLHVNVTGERVRAGQVVATLYSPEVFAAHQDLLVAKRQVEQMALSPESSRRAASAALDAGRQRLRLLGVPDEELGRMEKEERPTQAVPVRTPFAGTVIERIATEGAYVTTGTPLYRIADLSTLWVQLDAYESDLSRLSLKQSVRVSVDALPGEEFEGDITFINPTLDASRRTAQVRVAVDNRGRRLRPGMFAEAIVATEGPRDERSPLVVPATAPLFTGRRAVVYVEQQAGERTAYQARTVRLGPRLGDFYPVVAGLSEGERVVTRGAFAIDADLQIRGGESMISTMDDREQALRAPPIDLPKAERAKLSQVLSGYLSVQKALAADDLAQAKQAAELMSTAVTSVTLERPRDAASEWSEMATALRAHAGHVALAKDLEGARTGFEGLSESIQLLLRRFGNPLDESLQLVFCPMATGTGGATWIQQGTEVDNSYFGESMRTCGEIQQEVTAGSHLRSPKTPSAPQGSTAPAGGHSH